MRTWVLLVAACRAASDSCRGKCGYWSDSCWCDASCTAHGNCCDDYSEWCGSSALELRLLTAHADARCLDGSPAGYYFRSANSSRFLVYFEGGGWCYDQNCAHPTANGTIADCTERSRGQLGSSSKWERLRWYNSGALSPFQRNNPTFFDFSLIYVPYCDGTSLSGRRNTTVSGLYFRGADILEALIFELKHTLHLPQASQVVISGGSAGASTVLWHADRIVAGLGLTPGQAVAIPDAGFFLDRTDVNGIDCWPNQMRSLAAVSGARGHARCLERYPPTEAWRCMFPEYFADLISTRTLIVQSLYDSSEIQYTLRLGCFPGDGPACSQQQMRVFQQMPSQHMRAWAPLVNRSGNGVWGIACVAHTMTQHKWLNGSWAVPAGSGNTMAMAVRAWLDRKPVIWQDDVLWPHNIPCHTSPPYQQIF